MSAASRSPAERGARDPPTAACCPCGRRRPNNSLALWARYPDWSNPIVQDPSMFGSKFLFPWQVCLSSKSTWGVCVCIYSLYYKGVRKSKFLTKFAPYVAIIMCHFGLGLTLPSKGKRRGEVLRCWMSGMWAGQAADSSWAGTGAPRCILDEATGSPLPWSVHGRHLVLMEAEFFGFEAQAGDAVGHVHPLGGRRSPAGAVGGHSAVGREQGRNEAWPTEESPCPARSCQLPRPDWPFPLRHLPQEQSRLQHFYVAGCMWEPLKLCTRRPRLELLDEMAGRRELGTRKDPCHLPC